MSGVVIGRRRVVFGLGATVAAIAIRVRPERAGSQGLQPGGRILFVRDGNVWVWDEGDSSELFGSRAASDARWSPDGDQVLYVSNESSYSNLMLRDLATGAVEQLTDNAPPIDFEPGSALYVGWSSWARDPAWSESGRIAFIADYEESGRMALWLIETPGENAVLAPELAPEAFDIDGTSISVSGALTAYAVKMFDGVDYRTAVVLRDLSDGAVYPLVDEPGGVYDPAISPDEQWIAMTIRSTGGTSDIWIASRADRSATQVTFGEQAVASTWSPDGSWLAYLRPSGDGFALQAIPVARGGPAGASIGLGEWDGLDSTSGMSWSR